MSGTCTTANLGKTLENLNKVGGITWNPTKDTAIPPATTGLYELINKFISELVTLKNQIKTNEKVLITKLAGDADLSDGVVTLDDSTASRSAIIESTTASILGNARGGLTADPADKPAILTSSTAARNYSEDAIFDLLGGMAHMVMLLNNEDDLGEGTIAASVDNE